MWTCQYSDNLWIEQKLHSLGEATSMFGFAAFLYFLLLKNKYLGLLDGQNMIFHKSPCALGCCDGNSLFSYILQMKQ